MHAPMVTHVCVLGTTKCRATITSSTRFASWMYVSPRALRDLEAYWRHGEKGRERERKRERERERERDAFTSCHVIHKVSHPIQSFEVCREAMTNSKLDCLNLT